MLLRKLAYVVLALLLLTVVGNWLFLANVNDYQADGERQMAVLDAPVRVVRDGQGVPYVFADSLEDAIRAQGFVTAQDRLLQIEITRHLVNGRLAEVLGESVLETDRRHRVVGLHRHGARRAAGLSPAGRRITDLYLEGLNDYIQNHRDDHPFGLKLLGLEAQPWTLADAMSLRTFLNWASSQNLGSELVAQAIVDKLGAERAQQILPLSLNPDDGSEREVLVPPVSGLSLRAAAGWYQAGPPAFALGSNSWAMSGTRSAGGVPVLVNDPHVDSRNLPGNWHPIGLITPELRAVGLAGAGMPGFAVARTTHVAFGVTNAYGDVIDLYVETVDPDNPDHYLEGERSIAFQVIDETLKVRDRGSAAGFREVPLTIRLTRRGPVISDHGMTLADGRAISMRWTAAEADGPEPGLDRLIMARNVEEAAAHIAQLDAPYNFNVVDTAGNIAHITAGRVPVRTRGDGALPRPVTDGNDDWAGYIAADAMPGSRNPSRGWLGNANHRIVPGDYPFAYSTYFAASWRYRRMRELLDGEQRFAAEDHWQFMRDTKNLMAAGVAPVMSVALGADPALADLGERLAGWDHHDDTDSVATTIFQATYRHFARLTFEDELGPELTARMLAIYYFWHERLFRMVQDGAPDWFDDVRTPATETRDDLFRQAAAAARAELTALLGPDPAAWTWGRVHEVSFFSPWVPGKRAAGILGGGNRPAPGSGETLNRAGYAFGSPYDAKFIDSLRFVADLSDPDKIWSVLSGGASGRQFDPHLSDQVDPWLSGEPRYLWFSDAAIAADARSELLLTPN